MSTTSNNARDPREVEMLAIINMQPVPEEVRKGVEQLQLADGDAETSLAEQRKAAAAAAADDAAAEILTPGTKIRPDVGVEVARKLVERLYGIVASEVTELISYDDRNFLIKADRNITNPIIANHWPHGYILKVHNALDSRKAGFIDAQTQLMLFLGQQNVRCPRPVMNITGKYYSLERIASADDDDDESTTLNCVRLLEFVPGQLFHQIPAKTPHLYYQAGEFVGRLDNALRHFKHDAFTKQRSVWQLDSAPQLSQFVYALRDEARQEIVEQVLEQFERRVLSRIGEFQRGVIHGDFNEQNVVVTQAPNGGDWRISGVIDFGDASESCYVFELAIAMAYMILQGGDVATGGLVLAGYGMVRPVPEHEKEVLKVCVAARLCQSLVLGAYSHTLEPGNEYVLSTQAAGWELLAKLWSEPELLLRELWQSTGDRYLTQSSK